MNAPRSDRLCLHHLTAMDVDAAALVALAAGSGCEAVSLFTYMPAPFDSKYPMVRAADIARLRAVMDDTGVTCFSLEVFPIAEEMDWDAILAGLDIGAELGAGHAVAHVQAANAAAARESLARLARLAAARGIAVGIEANAFSAAKTIGAAADLAHGIAGVSLALDTLHAARAGTTPAEIAAHRDSIAYVQLSDGPDTIGHEDRWREAIGERLVPGQGAFDLVGMIAPLAPGIVFDVEVPQTRRMKAGVPATRRVADAVGGTRRVLHQAGRAGTFL